MTSGTGAGAPLPPFIPYVDADTISDKAISKLLDSTEDRLGFVPNSFLLYLHQPHLLRDINRLNNTVMRHPSNILAEQFKYQLALLVSRNQSCRYCTAHEVNSLKKKWGLSEDRISEILRLENPADEREEVAWAYANAASLGPDVVSDEMRSRLVEHFSPAEIMEIACTVGFWSLFNRIHSSLDIPLEPDVEHEAHWVEFPLR